MLHHSGKETGATKFKQVVDILDILKEEALDKAINTSPNPFMPQ